MHYEEIDFPLEDLPRTYAGRKRYPRRELDEKDDAIELDHWNKGRKATDPDVDDHSEDGEDDIDIDHEYGRTTDRLPIDKLIK
jgi:hypothetical protein